MSAELSGQVVAWATVALAIGTLWLAHTTRRAVNATRQDVQESRKARIDATAPRITFIGGNPIWPPHLTDPSDINAHPQLSESERFKLPEDAERVVWIAGSVQAANEGTTTAIVSMPSNAAVGDENNYRNGPMWRELREETRYVVAPHQALGGGRIVLQASRTVREWIDLYSAQGNNLDQQPPLSLIIRCYDTFADGVEDTTAIELRGIPLVPAEGGTWRRNPANSPPGVSVRVRPTERRYRSGP